MDIGAGTQDILVYDPNELPQNFLKIIYPSPTKIMAKGISNSEKNIFINGYTMGGGPVVSAIKNHIKKGFNVFMEYHAAKTVRDNLDEVTSMGVEVVHSISNPDFTFKDIDIDLIKKLTENYYPKESINLLVAVQDHGYIEGVPDRRTRMEFLKQFLRNGLKKAYFSNNCTIPEYLTRFNSVKNQTEDAGIKQYWVTDTAVVAALGATYNVEKFPVVTVDVGNGHTFVAIVDENRNVLSFFEHHTSMLSKHKIKHFISKLIDGTLTNEDIFDDKGHGSVTFKKLNSTVDTIYVTGPRRMELFSPGKDILFATPLGDMMITGPVGQFMQVNLL